MGIVFACISPHGAEAIPDLAGKALEDFAETRRGMAQLAEIMQKQAPETVILATPHGLRLEATIGVVTTEFSEGRLQEDGKSVELRCACDRELAKNIVENARKLHLPVVAANYGTNEGPASCMPMDWGTLIPMWFFAKNISSLKLVIVTPSREIPLANLIAFGQAIADTAEASQKRIAFVASADQAHAHRADGPYGINQAANEFDDIAKRAVAENNLNLLLDLPAQFIEDAKPDSVWQIAMLQGVLNRVRLKGILLSYQVPTYFGLLCAAYAP